MNDIQFLKINSSGQVAKILAEIITKQLTSGRSVLWLLSGGSAIEPAVEASKLLNDKDLSHLTISLADERYGEPGHKDSNWRSLIEQGFEAANAHLHPLLTDLTPKQTAAAFNQFINEALSSSDFKLALLGIGGDGHTAGILPNSPAVDSNDYAVYYRADDFERLTITAKGLSRLDEALVYARGDNKQKALDNLELDLPAAAQPAQIIKQIPRVSVYNDLKGVEI